MTCSKKASRQSNVGILPMAALFLVGAFYGSSSAATYTATDATHLQNLLDNTVVLGDTIILTANQTYTGTITLPDKGAGTSWITIKSSQLASLPLPGVRVTQANAVNMPKLQSPIGAMSTLGVKTSGAAHHYKFIGVEFIAMSNNAEQTLIVELGRNDSTQTQLSQCPHNIIFDRCIFRANSSTQQVRRAIALNTKYVEITNSRIADIKLLITGSDSQGIAIWNGPGPFVISNCFLEAASENILTGGSTLQIPNVIPSNLTVTRSHLYKPLSWQTANWNVKNLFELKTGKYVSLDGNRLENCWHQAGDFKGTAIAIKRVAQPNQGNTWTETDNVHINNNIVTNVGVGISTGGSTESYWGPGGQGDVVWTTDGWPRNITMYNNLFDKLTGSETWTGNLCYFYMLGSGADGLVTDHNSVFGNFGTNNSSRITDIGSQNSGPFSGFVFTNNIVQKGLYGFKSPLGDNEACFDTYMKDNGVASAVYKKNVTKALASSTMLPTYHGDWNPTTLAFPADFSTVLVNAANPGTNYAGYKVIAGSAYVNAGTDGKDIGCDIDVVNSATAGCVSGSWSGVAADSFEYTGSLGGQNDGFGYGTNAWVIFPGYTSPAITAGSLAYTASPRSIITKGNKLQPAINSRAYRNFSPSITTAGKTIWISFCAKQTGGSFPSNHAGFQLCDQVNGGGTGIFLGKPGASATNWGFDKGGTVVTATGTPDMDTFLLYKLSFTGTQVTISMWVNPPLTEKQLPAPTISGTYAHTANFASMWAGVGPNSSNYQFDEFRMSPVFTDVTK